MTGRTGTCSPAAPLENVTTRDYILSMARKIGIRELKARLSEYLREVQSGETILVTNRDMVVAELHPHYPATAPREDTEEVLDDLARTGEVTRAQRRKESWQWAPEGLGLPEGTAGALLDELRRERGEE